MAANRHQHPSWVTRREAIGLLGAAAGTCLTSALGDPWPFAAASAQATRRVGQTARFPNGAIIRTLLKDIPPDKIGSGAILFHEHLSYNNTIFEKLRSEAPPRPGAPPPPDPTTPYFMEDMG